MYYNGPQKPQNPILIIKDPTFRGNLLFGGSQLEVEASVLLIVCLASALWGFSAFNVAWPLGNLFRAV